MRRQYADLEEKHELRDGTSAKQTYNVKEQLKT
jgi:hypothetical protein